MRVRFISDLGGDDLTPTSDTLKPYSEDEVTRSLFCSYEHQVKVDASERRIVLSDLKAVQSDRISQTFALNQDRIAPDIILHAHVHDIV